MSDSLIIFDTTLRDGEQSPGASMTKDEKLRITLVSNAFDAFLDLGEGGEAFTSLATDDDGLSDTHAKLEWTAPEDGWYVVRARALAPNETGAYALAVERQP
jgi:isopropylmalate/homocitrate/citramalate synthase